jgi:hypothetical protein
LYNIFDDATTPMLFYKLEEDLWSTTKTFVFFLNRLPEYPKCYIHDIESDIIALDKLQILYNDNGQD